MGFPNIHVRSDQQHHRTKQELQDATPDLKLEVKYEYWMPNAQSEYKKYKKIPAMLLKAAFFLDLSFLGLVSLSPPFGRPR